MGTIITKEELLTQLKATMGKSKVIELSNILYQTDFALSDLMNLTFYHEKELAFRAAWILENLVLANPLQVINDTPLLINSFLIMKNPSCQRHYIKILMHLTDKKAPPQIQQKMAETDLEPLATYCFNLLIEPKSAEAIKVFCCQVLFNLRMRYNWILDLLPDQIKLLMDGGKPGINARGRMLLKALTK